MVLNPTENYRDDAAMQEETFAKTICRGRRIEIHAGDQNRQGSKTRCANNNRWPALLAVLVFSAGTVYAQEKATVSGTVTNAATGAPVLRAHVTVTGGRQSYGALTNGEGKYSITGLPPGLLHGSGEASGIRMEAETALRFAN